jgi:prophage regulatory protein
MNMQVLRLPAVSAKVGMKSSAIYRKIHEEGFPKPIPLGPKAVGWLEHEIDEWLTMRAAQRDTVAA